MWEHIRYNDYNGHTIRSSPIHVRSGKWKIRIDIKWPSRSSVQTISEHGSHEFLQPSLREAHEAGIERGRRIIDERLRSHKGTSPLTPATPSRPASAEKLAERQTKPVPAP